MNLNKKRITILVSLMCLLVLLVFTLCSFDLPDYPDQHSELLLIDNITSAERDRVKTIIDLQLMLGQFNSLEPLYIYHTNTFYAVFALPSATVTFSTSGSGSNTMYKYELSGTQSNAFVQIGFSDQGFAVYSVISASSLSISREYILYYRTSFSNSLSTSGYYSFSSGSSVRSDIADVEQYWQQYANVFIHSGASPEELESAYDSGFSDGYESGYSDGFDTGFDYGEQFGYQDGYQDGIGTGYTQGYLAGEADGYDTGYSEGYQDGYDTGYSEAERETIIRYVEPVELDVPRIFNAMGGVPRQVLDGVDFQIFGIPILGVLLSILILTISIFVIRKIK